MMDDFYITQQAKISQRSKTKNADRLRIPDDGALDSTLSQSARLQQKAEEMASVETELDQKRWEYEQQSISWEQREAQLRKQLEAFHEKVEKYRGFLNDSKQKIENYRKKEIDEKKQTKAKNEELAKLKAKLTRLETKKRRLEKKVQNAIRYQKFLESLYDANTNQFEEISSIIQRYEILKMANMDLSNNIENHKQEIAELNAVIIKTNKDGQNRIFELNNQLASLQRMYQGVKVHTHNTESEQKIKELKQLSTNQMLGEIRMCIENLYLRCEQSTRQVLAMAAAPNPNVAQSNTRALHRTQSRIINPSQVESTNVHLQSDSSSYNNSGSENTSQSVNMAAKVEFALPTSDTLKSEASHMAAKNSTTLAAPAPSASQQHLLKSQHEQIAGMTKSQQTLHYLKKVGIKIEDLTYTLAQVREQQAAAAQAAAVADVKPTANETTRAQAAKKTINKKKS